jgi:hypothetical protein
MEPKAPYQRIEAGQMTGEVLHVNTAHVEKC